MEINNYNNQFNNISKKYSNNVYFDNNKDASEYMKIIQNDVKYDTRFLINNTNENNCAFKTDFETILFRINFLISVYIKSKYKN